MPYECNNEASVFFIKYWSFLEPFCVSAFLLFMIIVVYEAWIWLYCRKNHVPHRIVRWYVNNFYYQQIAQKISLLHVYRRLLQSVSALYFSHLQGALLYKGWIYVYLLHGMSIISGYYMRILCTFWCFCMLDVIHGDVWTVWWQFLPRGVNSAFRKDTAAVSYFIKTASCVTWAWRFFAPASPPSSMSKISTTDAWDATAISPAYNLQALE